MNSETFICRDCEEEKPRSELAYIDQIEGMAETHWCKDCSRRAFEEWDRKA